MTRFGEDSPYQQPNSCTWNRAVHCGNCSVDVSYLFRSFLRGCAYGRLFLGFLRRQLIFFAALTSPGFRCWKPQEHDVRRCRSDWGKIVRPDGVQGFYLRKEMHCTSYTLGKLSPYLISVTETLICYSSWVTHLLASVSRFLAKTLLE
jgi:hypothetical protein